MKRKPTKLERRREIYNLTTVPRWERKSLAPVAAHVNAQTGRWMRIESPGERITHSPNNSVIVNRTSSGRRS